jgi:hypothetical protein
MDEDDKTTLPMSPEASKNLLEQVLEIIERGGSSPAFGGSTTTTKACERPTANSG